MPKCLPIDCQFFSKVKNSAGCSVSDAWVCGSERVEGGNEQDKASRQPMVPLLLLLQFSAIHCRTVPEKTLTFELNGLPDDLRKETT